MILWATEIKVRAERRCGELTMQIECAPGGAGMHKDKSSNDRKSKAQVLAEMGVSVQNANRYEQLAAMPPEHFEAVVATAKATAGEVVHLMQRHLSKMPPSKQRGANGINHKRNVSASDRGSPKDTLICPHRSKEPRKAECPYPMACRQRCAYRINWSTAMEPVNVTYPSGARVRASEICRNAKTGQPGLLPISRATWYAWVAQGKVPAGRRLGANTVVWPVEVVLAVGAPNGDADA